MLTLSVHVPQCHHRAGGFWGGPLRNVQPQLQPAKEHGCGVAGLPTEGPPSAGKGTQLAQSLAQPSAKPHACGATGLPTRVLPSAAQGHRITTNVDCHTARSPNGSSGPTSDPVSLCSVALTWGAHLLQLTPRCYFCHAVRKWGDQCFASRSPPLTAAAPRPGPLVPAPTCQHTVARHKLCLPVSHHSTSL